jgi:chromosomal replication initiator protein
MNVTPADINGKSRRKEFVQARQIVMYIAHTHTSLPASRIGRLIGGRDHSTVIHSFRKIEAQMTKDKDLAEMVALIEKNVKARKQE